MEIRDMKPVVFNKLLQFIYTNDCDVGEYTEELLFAAEKYDVKNLKELCEEELKTKLTVDNAVRLLMLSDEYQAKRKAIQFISGDATEFFVTNESSFDVLNQCSPLTRRHLKDATTKPLNRYHSNVLYINTVNQVGNEMLLIKNNFHF